MTEKNKLKSNNNQAKKKVAVKLLNRKIIGN